MKRKLLLLLTLLPINSFAYNNKRCWQDFYKRHVSGGDEWTFLTSTTLAPTSTGQFISSTGSCKMIGMNEQKRMMYVAENADHLRDESARGTGEYLEAYALLSGCKGSAMKELPRVFQKNFKQIYGDTFEKQLPDVYESMNDLVHHDPILSKGCSTKG